MMKLLSKNKYFIKTPDMLKFVTLSLIGFHFIFTEAHSQSNNKEVSRSYSKSSIEVSNLDAPSLGSIGIKTGINDLLGLQVWTNMGATEIVEHLNYIPDIISSKSLQTSLNDIYSSSSNPPTGNSDEIVKFLDTRLIKIKSSGQSKELYQLIRQLPDGKRWEMWQRWRIEYELMLHEDKKACRYIYEKPLNNEDYFWQMARIFCLSINDKLNQSKFIFDLIKSKGFKDKAFENLFQIMIGERVDFNFDQSDIKIQPLHLIMMDTLKVPIKANYIANLGVEYTDPLLTMTYLKPEAISFLLDRKLTYSKVPTAKIIQNYKSIGDRKLEIEKSFSNYKKNPNGQNRANVWISIITLNDEIKKVKAIIAFINMEAKRGRFNDTLNIYMPILEKIDKSSLTQKLNASIKKLQILNNPNLFPENNLSNMLILKNNTIWDWNIIFDEKAWPIIPILEDAGMKQPQNFDWLKIINKFNKEMQVDNTFDRWKKNNDLDIYILTKSIEQAAKNDNKTLTLLLVGRLIGNNPLIDIDLNHLIVIRNALFKLGLNDLANKMTKEIMISKFISF